MGDLLNSVVSGEVVGEYCYFKHCSMTKEIN
jgi:hypothetical protein